MPHVQLIGSCPLTGLAPQLAGTLEKSEGLVLKLQAAFLSPDAGQMILEALVVEGYLRQRFFLLVQAEENGILIRCHPTGAVQKTEGVKKLIALTARRCIGLSPGCRIGNTNLAALFESGDTGATKS